MRVYFHEIFHWHDNNVTVTHLSIFFVNVNSYYVLQIILTLFHLASTSDNVVTITQQLSYNAQVVVKS